MTPHHHHHHAYNLCNQTLSNPYCCCSCSCNSPPPTSTDQQQLLQFISANLFKTQSFVNKPQQQHHQQQQQQTHSQSLLQDLIRRVSSLESSLSQLPPASSSPPPSPSLLLRRRRTSPPPSLRELAARTIQARFRRFLVRRSQTLRDLKRLASIKSTAAALRSSISGGDADAEAMALLLQLDSIQSEDPMIRDGKRSISRELVRMWRLAVRAMEEVEEAAPPVPPTRSGKRVSFEEEGKERFARVLEKEGVFGYGLAAPLPVQMEPRLGF